jgi:hypothetical protein
MVPRILSATERIGNDQQALTNAVLLLRSPCRVDRLWPAGALSSTINTAGRYPAPQQTSTRPLSVESDTLII